MYGIRDIRIEDNKIPKIKPDEALVKIKSAGICGSDVHYYIEGKIGDQIVKGKLVLGHEAAGQVVKAGKNVKNFKAGDKVAIEPGISCGKCEHCLSGRPNICPNVMFLGTPPVHGAYKEYMAYPAKYLFKLPDSMSCDEGAVLEPLTIGMYTVELSELKPGDDAAIFGCGPIGFSILKSAVFAGANRIFVSDLIDERLKLAKKYGNVTAINPKKGDPVEMIKKVTNGRGVDIAYEAAGKAETIAECSLAVRIGGKIIWCGITSEDSVPINPHILRKKEILIKNVRRAKHQYARCINAVSSGAINVKDMVTHVFKLKDINKAFEFVENYRDGVMKAIIKM